ncbi:uncharacterized protein LOC115979297 [Quercus lobata]|uniref:uncharacterized protein LOC115979297 n=1 Tax=Quercus lobata TaxID=97700 RepID=UPI0012469AF5|nr:uncharacterized protein LOC115979297 [Quercus lobata]
MKSVQELASQAATRAKAEAAKNITPPKSAYQFDASLRRLSNDRALQARLLKITRFGMKYFVARQRQLSMQRCLINFVQDTASIGDKRVLKEILGMVFVLSHFHFLYSAIIIPNHLNAEMLHHYLVYFVDLHKKNP